MKVKSKISYLGERNSILPGQMAEQLAVEVNVKNVMYRAAHMDNWTSPDNCFGLDSRALGSFLEAMLHKSRDRIIDQ